MHEVDLAQRIHCRSERNAHHDPDASHSGIRQVLRDVERSICSIKRVPHLSACPPQRFSLRSQDNENPLDTLAACERGACHLRALKHTGENALPRLCASGAKMPARQFPATASDSHLSLLLRASRQVRLSECSSCDGKADREHVRSPLGGCDNDAHPPLWRSLLPLARFRRSAKP